MNPRWGPYTLYVEGLRVLGGAGDDEGCPGEVRVRPDDVTLMAEGFNILMRSI